ncbi:hypothetical protein QYB59_000037 [Clostridium perfringens]|nr:hypothetical protein [Clostridium perfringens]ELC8441043.1 hypothetical protein [Clostridium perfringens]HAT4093559.1 hypothetical protein [Clostridium perfringens]
MNYLQPNNYPNFYICLDNSDDLKKLLDFILIEYELLFSKEVLCNSKCTIINYPLNKYPQFLPFKKPQEIHLSVDSFDYYAWTTYQLSHELCHYILHQTSNNLPILSWFEETLCEAFSLYILDFCYEKWSDCEIAKKYPCYNSSMLEYLIKEFNKSPNDGLKKCTSLNNLKYINSISESDRSQRILERNSVYKLFKEYRDDIYLITNYRKYIISDILIDFERWLKDTNNNQFIKELSKIQPLVN